MAKILILTGSVRKGGNTDLLAKAFADGAKVNNDVEIVSVADYKINPCIGCNACFESKDNKCFQEDDMHIVYEKMAKADVLAIASPVYFYGISAQLKAVIDRLHNPIRDGFNIKKLVLLSVAGATIPTVFDGIKVQYKLVLNYFNLEDAGMVLAKGVRNIGDIEGNQALKDAFDLGKSIK